MADRLNPSARDIPGTISDVNSPRTEVGADLHAERNEIAVPRDIARPQIVGDREI
jgi:hypothetical protein